MIRKIAPVLVLVFASTLCFGWGQAAHTYIDNQLHHKSGGNVLDEMYGGMAPDIFNFVFQLPLPVQQQLYVGTHQDGALLVWYAATNPRERALAFGFLSHNDGFGADFTAHHHGITFGQQDGYIIAKARILAALAQQNPQVQALGLEGQALEDICHQLVENAVDILVTDLDADIGARLMTAATNRSRTTPDLLVRAYGPSFAGVVGGPDQAAAIIRAAEDGFRKETVLYGSALTQDKNTALQLIAAQMAQMAPDFMKMYGIIVPQGVDLQPVVAQLMGAAMTLCQDDYAAELNATVGQVRDNLAARGIAL